MRLTCAFCLFLSVCVVYIRYGPCSLKQCDDDDMAMMIISARLLTSQ